MTSLEKLAQIPIAKPSIVQITKQVKKTMSKENPNLQKTKSLLNAIKAETKKLENTYTDPLDFDITVEENLSVLCPMTNIEIYRMENSKKIRLASHGECRKCKQDFHIDAMKTVDGMTKASWVVVYCGFQCKECYNKKE